MNELMFEGAYVLSRVALIDMYYTSYFTKLFRNANEINWNLNIYVDCSYSIDTGPSRRPHTNPKWRGTKFF